MDVSCVMGLRSPGHDAVWMSTMMLALLRFAMVQLAASVAAESDYRTARKVLCYDSPTGNRTIYDYEINDVHDKQAIDWSQYVGNVVLLVNVASF